MSDLTELLERLEKATGPDRELDFAIFMIGPPKEFMGEPITIWCEFHPPETSVSCHTAKWLHKDAFTVPSYTASLDACKALQDAVLPGWFWAVLGPFSGKEADERGYLVYGWETDADYAYAGFKHPHVLTDHQSECNARLMAIVKALIEKEREDA